VTGKITGGDFVDAALVTTLKAARAWMPDRNYFVTSSRTRSRAR
jgi:hypothetical protein